MRTFVDGNASGPTVVFVHGWPDDHTMWDTQVRVCARLHARVRGAKEQGRGLVSGTRREGSCGTHRDLKNAANYNNKLLVNLASRSVLRSHHVVIFLSIQQQQYPSVCRSYHMTYHRALDIHTGQFFCKFSRNPDKAPELCASSQQRSRKGRLQQQQQQQSSGALSTVCSRVHTLRLLLCRAYARVAFDAVTGLTFERSLPLRHHGSARIQRRRSSCHAGVGLLHR